MKQTVNDTRAANEIKKVAKRIRCPYLCMPGEFLITRESITSFSVTGGRVLDSTGEHVIDLPDILKTTESFEYGDGNGSRVYDSITEDGYAYVFAISNGVTSDVVISESIDDPEAPNGFWFKRIASFPFISTSIPQFYNYNREYLFASLTREELTLGNYTTDQELTVYAPPETVGIFVLFLKRNDSSYYSSSQGSAQGMFFDSEFLARDFYTQDISVNGAYQSAMTVKKIPVPSDRILTVYYWSADAYLFSSVYCNGWEDKNV